MYKDLLIQKKTEQLLYQIYPRLINFPKSEKHSLCLHIKESFFNILKNIALGNAVKSKRKTYLQEADAHLQTLKILIKLANHQKYISKNFFKLIDVKLTEINKMLSGYIKSTVK
jgi:four helix bundle protein